MRAFRLVAPLLAALCATGTAGTFVYTNNNIATNSVSGYSVSATGGLTAVPGSPFPTGGDGNGFTVGTRMIRVVNDKLYVVNAGIGNLGGTISAFTINPNSGVLTPVPGSPFSGSLGGLAATPDGKYLYGMSTTEIRGFSVASNGALTPLPPLSLNASPGSMTITPADGRFMVVTLPERHEISSFWIDPATGALSPVTFGSPYLGPLVEMGTLDCNCAQNRIFMAVPNYSRDEAAVYTITPTGTLSGGGVFYGAGQVTSFGLLSADDSKLFVTNQWTQTVDTFKVASTGYLSVVPGAPFPAGGAPSGAATDRDGKWLFAADWYGRIIVYAIDPDGVLRAVPGSPFSNAPLYTSLTSLAVYPAKTCCLAPAIGNVSASPNALWPPNKKMVSVNVDYPVTAACPGTCTLSVSGSEPGGVSDWDVIDAHHVMLRADRSGAGERIYTITITCTNSGNGLSSSGQVTIVVPHDQGH